MSTASISNERWSRASKCSRRRTPSPCASRPAHSRSERSQHQIDRLAREVALAPLDNPRRDPSRREGHTGRPALPVSKRWRRGRSEPGAGEDAGEEDGGDGDGEDDGGPAVDLAVFEWLRRLTASSPSGLREERDGDAQVEERRDDRGEHADDREAVLARVDGRAKISSFTTKPPVSGTPACASRKNASSPPTHRPARARGRGSRRASGGRRPCGWRP